MNRHRGRILGPSSWPSIKPGVASLPSSGGGSTLYPVFTTSGTGPFTVQVQVTNLATGLPVSARYWVLFGIGTTEWAADTSDTVTLNTGETLGYVNDAMYKVLTNSSGFCEIEITASADRYVSAAVGSERAYSSGLLDYSVGGVPGEWQFNDTVNSGQVLTIGF